MAAADDRPLTLAIITDEYHDLESPVRLEWPSTSAGPEWLAHDHPGLTAEERPGRDGQPQTWHSSIVVPLRRKEESVGGWSEPGASDEYDMNYWTLTARPASPEEAAPLLAEENRVEATLLLLDRITTLLRQRNSAKDFAPDPDLPHVDMSDEPEIRAQYKPEYADDMVRSARHRRHMGTLDGYVLALPGSGRHDPEVMYPDPALGLLWVNWGYNMITDCYRLDDTLVKLIDSLEPLLNLHGVVDRRSLTREQVATVFGVADTELDRILAAFGITPLEPSPSLRHYEGMGDGQVRYGRVRVLNAHRHMERHPRHVEEHHARELERVQWSEQRLPRPTRRQQREVGAVLDELRDLTPNW
ncbi:hypothetical protein ACIRG5_45825 [Lentzea sp. NPDC102401]|uniref:hypothetical protein n=1 Tax=Lentzea sp. NPDC102401 TaxID=3364128 RepID=UPI0037F4049F